VHGGETANDPEPGLGMIGALGFGIGEAMERATGLSFTADEFPIAVTNSPLIAPGKVEHPL